MKQPNKKRNSRGDMLIDEGSVSEAEWEIWYQDLFDRESPRMIEISGLGLVNGLIELWRRHLFETVQADGGKSFSRFNLWWKQEHKSIEINGEWQGQMQLREWVFGRKRWGEGETTEDLDTRFLEQIAEAHLRDILRGKTCEVMLEKATASKTKGDYEQYLSG